MMADFFHPWISRIHDFGESREWIAFVAFCLIGLTLAWTINNRLTKYLLGRFSGAGHGLSDKIIRAINLPISIVVFGNFFLLAFDQFKKMPHAVWQWAHNIYPLLNIVAVFVFALRTVDLGVELFRRRFSEKEGSLDESWCRLIAVIGKCLVCLFGLIFGLEALGQSVLPLITGASFLGAGFALAAQSTLANMIGSFEIMMDRLFTEGDRISFGEYDGFVTKMGLRSIQLVSMTGEKINLPNKDLVDKQIRNYSRKGRVCTVFIIGLTYNHTRAQINQAMALLREIVGRHPLVQGEVTVTFKNLGAYTLDLSVCCWASYKNGLEYVHMISDFNLAIKEEFDAAKLDFAFPTSTVHLHQAGAPGPIATENRLVPTLN